MSKSPRSFEPGARRITVSARCATLVLPFMSDEETRYYLNGIYIEPHPLGGVVMVATDGYLLGAVWDPDGVTDRPWICTVPPLLAAACRKQKARDNLDVARHLHFIGHVGYVTNELFADGDDPEMINVAHLATAYAPPIDGDYPEWRRVLPAWPEAAPPKPVGINPGFLPKFVAAAKTAEFRDGRITLFPAAESSRPVIVRIDQAPEFLGLWMPTRCALPEPDQADGLPGWLRPPEKTRRKPKRKMKP